MNKRVVVITGATGVLGREAVRAFAERGASLALLSRNQTELDSLARDLNQPTDRIFTRAVNLLDAQAVRDSAEAVAVKFGGVHILIHLIGGWTGGKTIVESSVDELTSMLNQHVWTTFHLFQAFVPHLIASGWGRVIVVSSPVTTNPTAKRSAYAAGKSAQETLVLTLAEEVREQDITANIIHVQSIDVNKSGKGTSPSEIIAAMMYLCSDEASKVTGARIPNYT